MAEKEPSSTIRIEETIKNAPVDDDSLEEARNKRKRKGRNVKQVVIDDDDDGDEFPSFLQNHTVKIHLDRVSPREFKGKSIHGMIEEYVPPITQEEIETDVRNRFGGGRYRIRVLKNGRFVAARGFHVYGDPKLPEEDFEPEEFRPEFPSPGRGYEFEPPSPIMDNDINELRKNIEKEKLKKALKEVKGEEVPKVDPEKVARETEDRLRKDYEFKSSIDSLRHDMDKRFSDMVGNLSTTLEKLSQPKEDSEAKRQHELKMIELENKVERMKSEVMGEVKSLTGDLKNSISEMVNRQPKEPDRTPDILSAIITGFSNISNSGNDKFMAWADAERAKSDAVMASLREINEANMKVSQAQTDKVVSLVQTMLQNDGNMGQVAKTVAAVRDMAEVMGMTPAGAGQESEPQDPVSRILGLVEKALPSLMAAQQAKSQRGQSVSKEEVAAIIQQQAQAEAQRVAHQVRSGGYPQLQFPQQESQPQPPQTQPQPSPQQAPQAPQAWAPPPYAPPGQPQPEAPSSGEHVAGGVSPEHGMTEPGTAPQATPPQEASEGAPPIPPSGGAPPPQREMSIEDEKVARVNDCFAVLLREIYIRPRSPSWPEYAFDNLPGDVLDRLVLATKAEEVLSAVKGIAKDEFIETLEGILAKDQRYVDWFVNGLNDLKMWYAEGSEEEEGDKPSVPVQKSESTNGDNSVPQESEPAEKDAS